jgi:hypothetical protein
MACSSAAAIPFVGIGLGPSSDGVGGLVIMARPASESASYKSGGSRSFSISDLRLHVSEHCKVHMMTPQKGVTYASSKLVMASLMPSAPEANVPYGSLDAPDILLSSDTRSDSSLPRYESCQRGKKRSTGQTTN